MDGLKVEIREGMIMREYMTGRDQYEDNAQASDADQGNRAEMERVVKAVCDGRRSVEGGGDQHDRDCAEAIQQSGSVGAGSGASGGSGIADGAETSPVFRMDE